MKRLVFAALALGLAASFSAYPQGGKDAGGKLDRKEVKALKELADADMAEVQAGKLGAGKAKSDDVKQFAQKMQDDHGQNLEELRTLAQSKGVDLPGQPSKKHQAEAKKLQSASADRFDRAYMDHMVKDHKADVKKLSDAAKSARDPDVKAFLEKTRDTVQGHLQLAQQVDQSVKGGKSASSGSSTRK